MLIQEEWTAPGYLIDKRDVLNLEGMGWNCFFRSSLYVEDPYIYIYENANQIPSGD